MWPRSRSSARRLPIARTGSVVKILHPGAIRQSSQVANEDAVEASSTLRQQLEFCCLVSGWDTPCTTCPFDWSAFDPRERYRILRRSPASNREVEEAIEVLGLTGTEAHPSTRGKPTKLCPNAVKAAFRRKALEWHPDCNKQPEAAEKFREILVAYELLVALIPVP